MSRAVGISAATLAAAGGAGLFAAGALQIVGGILALLAAVASAINSALGSNDQIVAHKKAKDAFAELATSLALFHRVKMKSDEAYETLEARYIQLMARRERITSEAPRVPMWAKRKLKESSELDSQENLAPPQG